MVCVIAGHTVQWGAWASVGMAAASAAALARIRRSGMGVITPAAGLALLQRLLSAAGPSTAQVQVMECCRMRQCVSKASMRGV